MKEELSLITDEERERFLCHLYHMSSRLLFELITSNESDNGEL